MPSSLCPAIRSLVAPRDVEQAGLHVVLQDDAAHSIQGGFHRRNLDEDVGAGPAFRDHPVDGAHVILEKVRRDLFHEVGRIGSVMIHADPTSHDGTDHHRSTAHHEPALYLKR